jgi:hypothetical protein
VNPTRVTTKGRWYKTNRPPANPVRFILEELIASDSPFSKVAGAAGAVLACFGFLISLLDFFWPLAMTALL